MPVFYFCRNVNTVTRIKLDCFFALFLIISATCHAHKYLTAATLSVMDMPVISTSRLECYIENSYLTWRYRCKVTLSDKIFCKCVIWFTDWKYHLLCMSPHCFILVWQISLAIAPNFLCKIKYCPAFWPACIKSNMSDDCCDFFLCHTVVLCILQMEF